MEEKNMLDDGSFWIDGEVDGDPAIYCSSESALESWAEYYGWESAADLYTDIGTYWEELKGRWFLIMWDDSVGSYRLHILADYKGEAKHEIKKDEDLAE